MLRIWVSLQIIRLHKLSSLGRTPHGQCAERPRSAQAEFKTCGIPAEILLKLCPVPFDAAALSILGLSDQRRPQSSPLDCQAIDQQRFSFELSVQISPNLIVLAMCPEVVLLSSHAIVFLFSQFCRNGSPLAADGLWLAQSWDPQSILRRRFSGDVKDDSVRCRTSLDSHIGRQGPLRQVISQFWGYSRTFGDFPSRPARKLPNKCALGHARSNTRPGDCCAPCRGGRAARDLAGARSAAGGEARPSGKIRQ